MLSARFFCSLQVENGPLHDSTVSASAKARPTEGATLHARLRLGYGQHQVMAQESVDDWYSIRPSTELGENLDGARRLSRLATISKIYAQATAPWGLSTAPCDYQSDAFRSSTTTAGLGNSRPPCGDGMRGCEFHTKGMAMCSERASSASAITLGAQARPQRDSRREQLLACPNETAPQVVSSLLCVKALSPVPPFLLLAKCVHAIDSHLTTPCKVLTYCVLPLLSSF